MIAYSNWFARCVESLLSIFALLVTTLFFLAVMSIKTVNINGKVLMLSHCVSLYIVVIASLMKSLPGTFEMYENKEFMRYAGYFHSYGFALTVLSFVSIVIEQLLSSISMSWTQTFMSRVVTIISVVVPYFLSFPYIFIVHHLDKKKLATLLAFSVNIFSLIILRVAWKISSKKYVREIGISNLRRRYQLYESFEWTKAVLPAAMVGLLIKVASVVLISMRAVTKSLIIGQMVSFGFRSFLIFHSIMFPVVMIILHSRLRQKSVKILRWFVVKLLNRQDVRYQLTNKIKFTHTSSQKKYFELLEQQWN